MNPTPATRASLARDLTIAGLLIAAGAAYAFVPPEIIDRELSRRLLGVLMGAFVVFYSNESPKAIPRRLGGACDTSGLGYRRFAGWSLVLGGIAYALTWLVAPIDTAELLSMGLLGTAFLLVLARVAWGRGRKSQA